jgi:hypothetical protein
MPAAGRDERLKALYVLLIELALQLILKADGILAQLDAKQRAGDICLSRYRQGVLAKSENDMPGSNRLSEPFRLETVLSVVAIRAESVMNAMCPWLFWAETFMCSAAFCLRKNVEKSVSAKIR